jgi:hypothetical protein
MFLGGCTSGFAKGAPAPIWATVPVGLPTCNGSPAAKMAFPTTVVEVGRLENADESQISLPSQTAECGIVPVVISVVCFVSMSKGSFERAVVTSFLSQIRRTIQTPKMVVSVSPI